MLLLETPSQYLIFTSGSQLLAEYVFDAGLNNHDRAIVHAECKKYGFTSKSYG